MAPAFERSATARGPVVQGFSGNAFIVGDKAYESLLLTPETVEAWQAPPLGDLETGDLAPVLDLDPAPEFLILGTGPFMAFAPPRLQRALEERGIGIEAMDSRAAARTWGLLRSEERWIAAAIMPLRPVP